MLTRCFLRQHLYKEDILVIDTVNPVIVFPTLEDAIKTLQPKEEQNYIAIEEVFARANAKEKAYREATGYNKKIVDRQKAHQAKGLDESMMLPPELFGLPEDEIQKLFTGIGADKTLNLFLELYVTEHGAERFYEFVGSINSVGGYEIIPRHEKEYKTLQEIVTEIKAITFEYGFSIEIVPYTILKHDDENRMIGESLKKVPITSRCFSEEERKEFEMLFA